MNKTENKIDFNFTSIYPHGYRPSIAKLCKEIADEEQCGDVETVRMKISGRNGLVTKLKKAGFDIWKIAGNDQKQKYDALKLIKLLYRIEKGIVSGKPWVNITTLLMKPSLENLEQCAEILAEIREQIYGQISDDTFYTTAVPDLLEICTEWEKLLLQLGDFVFKPACIARYEDIESSLKRVQGDISDLAATIEISDCQDSVLVQFVIFLFSYEVRSQHYSFLSRQCNDDAMSQSIDAILVSSYREKLSLAPQLMIPWDQVDLAEQVLNDQLGFLKGEDREDEEEKVDTEKVEAVFLIGYLLASVVGLNPSFITDKAIRERGCLSIQHAKVVAKWIEQRFTNLQWEKEIPLQTLAGIIQTIYLVDKNHEKYVDYTYGAHKVCSMMSSLRSEKEPSTIVVFEWENRIANRILHIHGNRELINECHQAQRVLADLEEKLLSCGNIATILETHNRLYSEAKAICCRISSFA